VAVGAPSVFRATGATSPERHAEAAHLLGERVGDVRDAGELLARRVIDLMKQLAIPNGIAACGYTRDDIDALVAGAAPQQRLLANAPMHVGEAELGTLFTNAMEYW
jgi:hydroxyacid-oxoacid transhydrogenase